MPNELMKTLTVGANTYDLPQKTSDLTNDSNFITLTTADDTYVPKTKTQNYHTNSITYNSGQHSSSIIIKSDGFSNRAGIGVYAEDNGYPSATIFVGDISSTNTFITGQNSSGTYATINTTETTINGVVTPTTDGMAANKKYVDDSISSLSIPSKTSDLTNDSGFIAAPSANVDEVITYNGTTWVADKRMVILSYGSSTWTDFINAYNSNAIVYCRASSNSDPASGAQTRMAFMAYVNSATPTNVEFQYYRSVSSHSDSQQGDQVFIYKLDKTAGWSVTTRNSFTKIAVGAGLSSSYASQTLTITNTQTGLPAVTSSDNGKVLRVVSGSWSAVELPSASGVSF